MSSAYKLVCPHCSGRMRIRTREGTHIFLRIAYLQCVNEACGWFVRAEFEMTHEMSPGGMSNPSVRLPVAPVALRRQAMKSASQDDQPDLLDQLDMDEQTA
ncbi:Ogr/Delta-like zinc finger protein [Pseudomonas alabamensis]|uniref:ogr/Delta-like zinc finger family protein n=1 Tax=Pseudomonas alabamensis TaxID=3064349 RepID=UPI0021D85EEB|nr:ogr/Delta-like zinc finger family protein [Pseudomonas entomophila]